MRKRIFLDEDIDPSVAEILGSRAHIHTAKSLGVLGKSDTEVITKAAEKCCLIVTANQDFIDFYRNHPLRKRGIFFYGLIFLSEQTGFEQQRQLKIALKEIAWKSNRQLDGLVVVRKDGKVCREVLCCTEHRKIFEEHEIARRKIEKIGPSRHVPLKYHHKESSNI